MADRPLPARPALPPLAWAGLILFGVLMLGLLTAQVLLIEDQRSTVDKQLKTAVRQAHAALPLIEDAQPLVEQLRAASPALGRGGRDAAALLDEIERARPGEQLEAAGALARTLMDAGVGDATREVRALADAVQRADLPAMARTFDALAGELLRQNRLRRVLVRSASVLGETRARHTVAKVTTAAELAPEQLRVLKESIGVQRETLAITWELLEVARSTERHAASIDQKTGGQLVPPAGG